MVTLESFAKILSGENENGAPNCRVSIFMGQDADYLDCGEAEMTGTWKGNLYEITLKFTRPMSSARAFSRVEDYLRFLDPETGMPNANHSLEIVLNENTLHWKGYIVGSCPVFSAFCAEKPGEMADTLKLLFLDNTILYVPTEDMYEAARKEQTMNDIEVPDIG